LAGAARRGSDRFWIPAAAQQIGSVAAIEGGERIARLWVAHLLEVVTGLGEVSRYRTR